VIEQATIEAVKGHPSIPDVLMGNLPGGLKREGRSWRGMVPWREDEHASLTVYEKGGVWLWSDVTQGVNGNIFQLLERWHGMDFPTAVEWLAQRLGVTVAKDTRAKVELASVSDRLQRLGKLYDEAEPLADGTACAEYLRKRGLLEAARAMPVKGYNPGKLGWLRGERLDKYGLGRLNWWGEKGEGFLVYGTEIIGSLVVHRTRLLCSQAEAKEKGFNTAHGHISDPGELGLPALWPPLGDVAPESEVILTEGETDAMAVRTLVPGAKAYAIFGASMFHARGAEFKAIVEAKARVVLAMQSDTASRDAAKRIMGDFAAVGVTPTCLVPASGVKDWAEAVAVGASPTKTIQEAGAPYGDDTLTRAFADLRKYSTALRTGKIVHTPLPWPLLQQTLGRRGLPPKSLGLLSARTGAGKSWFALYMAMHSAACLAPTYYVNTEMDTDAMMARILGIREGSSEVASMSEPSAMDEAMYNHPEVLKLALGISPPDPRSLDDVLDILAEKAKAKVRFLVVDHIGDLDCGRLKPFEALPAFALKARGIAHAAGVAILLVTHLKSGEGDDVMAFSRQIEHKVDYSISLTRHPKGQAELQGGAGVVPVDANMLLTVRKNRYGESDTKIAYLLDKNSLSLTECGYFKKWVKGGGNADSDWTQ